MKNRMTVVGMHIFVGYTGTGVPTSYKFCCWNDDKNAELKMKRMESRGKFTEFMNVSIPIGDEE